MIWSSFDFLPGCCVLCRSPSQRKLDLCAHCELDLCWLGKGCASCGLPMADPMALCPECQQTPPPFSAIIAAFEYRFPVSHMIRQFKDNRRLAEGRVLTECFILRHQSLLQKLATADQDPVIVVPVPLHPSTKRRRGFNQSSEIADRLGRHLSLRVAPQLIRRTSRSVNQKQLSRQMRGVNLKGAFECDARLNGLRVLLVDDVVTTTATMREISKILLKAGADDVVGLALARTPRSP